jgi:RNA polymerase sigma factor (sigma-70 family)
MRGARPAGAHPDPIFRRGAKELAAVPSIGRANHVEGASAPEADLTRTLYEQYANQIFRYCLHQLGSREEAEDAVQSTFLNAFRGVQRGVVPELESAWLFKIAHNVCLSRHRTAWRRGRIESPADFELVEELAPAPSRRADELIGLQDVLEQMPETQRRAILLREWQGLSYREIAAELELTQTAVETLIFRARRSLAAGLEEPPQRRRRIARAADLGNVAAALKSLLLGGGVAAKLAVTAAVVGAGAVVAVAPQHRQHPAPVRPVAPSHALPVTGHATAKPAAAVSATRERTDPRVFRSSPVGKPAHARPSVARTPPGRTLTPPGLAKGRLQATGPGAGAVHAAKPVTPPTSRSVHSATHPTPSPSRAASSAHKPPATTHGKPAAATHTPRRTPKPVKTGTPGPRTRA